MTALRTPALRALLTIAVAIVCAVPAPVLGGKAAPPAGSLDTTFGRKGVVITSFGTGRRVAAAGLALQADGKSVLAGLTWLQTSGNNDIALARYTRTGTLDSKTFGTGGQVVSDLTADVVVSTVALQPDGKILVAGHAQAPYQLLVARYLPTGLIDASFGTGGVATYDFIEDDTAVETDAKAIAVGQDGKILLAGYANTSAGLRMRLLRYDSTGTLDGSFGTAGVVSSSELTFGTALAIQADGRILVAGVASGDFAIARYDSTGTLDPTFGSSGTRVTDLSSGSTDEIVAMVAQSDGTIVVAGTTFTSRSQVAIARYDSTGTLDSGFGSNGRTITDFSGGGQSVAYGLARQADGTFVIVGQSITNSAMDVALARFTSGGTVDAAFGTNGRVVTDVGGQEYPVGVRIQADGRILVGGSSDLSTGKVFVLVRYNP